ncbi:MAG: CDP-alcohol phosphatidyltransferase family protein [Calditrichaeota bacterium]|nr:CDP-alcohol phosphatidyltransferase family protein [Calditrichota bacterium]
MTQKRVFTIPNLLTLTRLVLFIPTASSVVRGGVKGNLQAAFFLALMALTDILDGYIARHYHQKSELGRVLDPVVDKICVGGLFVLLAWQRALPLWLVGLVVGRDVLILLAGLFILSRYKRVTESTAIGKAAVAVLIATVFVFLFDIEPLKQVSIYASAIGVVVSGVAYTVRFVGVLRGKIPVPPAETATGESSREEVVSVESAK